MLEIINGYYVKFIQENVFARMIHSVRIRKYIVFWGMNSPPRIKNMEKNKMGAAATFSRGLINARIFAGGCQT